MDAQYVQSKIGKLVATEMANQLHCEVTIGKIELGLFDRFIINDVLLKDKEQQDLLSIKKLTTKFKLLPIFEGKIVISNVQLFDFQAQLEKKTPESRANYQYILDAFATKDTVQTKTAIDLRINSIILRRGKIAYNVLSEPQTPGVWNPHHIVTEDIDGRFSIKALNSDSLYLRVQQFHLKEQAGLELKKLSFKLVANHQHTQLSSIRLDLPSSQIRFSNLFIATSQKLHYSLTDSTVSFNGSLDNSYIALKDLSCFNTAFKDSPDKLELGMRFSRMQNKFTVDELRVSSPALFRLEGHLSAHLLQDRENSPFSATIQQMVLTNKGMEYVQKSLQARNIRLPHFTTKLGVIQLNLATKGTVRNNHSTAAISTAVGELQLDLTTHYSPKKINGKALVNYQQVNLGSLLNKSNPLGLLDGVTTVDFSRDSKKNITGKLTSTISRLEYQKYTYSDIKLQALYKNKQLTSSLDLLDKNGSLTIKGELDNREKKPNLTVLAEAKRVNPYKLKMAPEKYDANYSSVIEANIQGDSMEDAIGTITVKELDYRSKKEHFSLGKLVVASTQTLQERKLSIQSNFLNGFIIGNYSYKELINSCIARMHQYLPTLFPKRNETPTKDKQMSFSFACTNAKLLSTIFKLPVHVNMPLDLKGFLNEKENKMEFTVHLPSIQHKKDLYESGFIHFYNDSTSVSSKLRLSRTDEKEKTINLTFDVTARHDSIRSWLTWGNANEVSNYGSLASTIRFSHSDQSSKKLRTQIAIDSTSIVLKDSIWNLSPTTILIDSGFVDIHQFVFKHKQQHIIANGRLGKSPTDTLKTSLKDVHLSYIFNLVGLNLDFNGMATGKAYVAHAYDQPKMQADLQIKNYAFNKAIMGDMQVKGNWDNQRKGVYLDALIQKGATSETTCKGYILVKDKGLDLQFKGKETNVAFLNEFLYAILSDFKGGASGDIRLYGGFKALNLDGKMNVNASCKMNELNIPIQIKDTVYFRKEGITFINNRIADQRGNQGLMNGSIRYKHFKDVNYLLRFNTNNMLIYNIKKKVNSEIYGTVYATGDALVTGSGNNLSIDMNMTTEPNSTFSYVTNPTISAVNNEFIKFVDKSFHRKTTDTLTVEKKKENSTPTPSQNININISLNANENATVNIIMDPITGDYISMHGNGALKIDYFNKGAFNMFGDYIIKNGIYHFSMQEIIRKNFLMRSGSTLSFQGDPERANLDLKTYYAVNSASLKDLGITDLSQNNVKVNCLMNITGSLKKPTFNFDIELPNVSEEEKEIVQSTISTDEEMNMQVVYLLGVGKFYRPNYLNNDTQSSNAMSSVLSSTLSGQLNRFISQVINSNKWNFGTNLSTGEKGWTDVEVEGLFSGQLFNDRLLVNGNFGYKDNPLSKSNFVGDFSVEYVLNKAKDLRLKAYNQTNDRYFERSTLTTQGVGILYKKDFSSWRDLFHLSGKKK
ncbi:MAG: translocation/assembly module TamB domain-containing protein [Bacteroidaceae bacterium]